MQGSCKGFSSAGILAIVMVTWFCGCSGPTVTQKGVPGPLKELSDAYLQATAKLNRPPKDAEELKPYLAEGKSVDSLLKSPNDNEPYVILWGTDARTGMDLKPLVIGYEKKGINGTRFVFTAMGVMLMSPEDFKEANFPAGHKPQ